MLMTLGCIQQPTTEKVPTKAELIFKTEDSNVIKITDGNVTCYVYERDVSGGIYCLKGLGK